MKIQKFHEFDEKAFEAFMQQKSLDQLKMLRRLTKGTDIGDRVSDMNKQGANISYIRNPIDSGIDTQQSWEREQKKFVPCWNLHHLLSPYTGVTQDSSYGK